MKIFNLFELRRWDVSGELIGTSQEGGTSGLPSPEEMAEDLSDLGQEAHIDSPPKEDTPDGGEEPMPLKETQLDGGEEPMPLKETQLDGVNPLEETPAAEPVVSDKESVDNTIVLSTFDWHAGKRPEGYQSTTEMHDKLKAKHLRSKDVLGLEKVVRWNALIYKAYNGGLTAQESDEMVALSKEYNANARTLLESQAESVQPSTPVDGDEAPPVVAPSADSGEPLPAEASDNEIIKDEIDGLTENYLVDAKKNILENDSLPKPVKKALLASIDSRIRRSKLRDQLVDKEASLAERQKSLAEYNKNIARLKKGLGFIRFALIGVLLAGGLGASMGAVGGKELAFILGGLGGGIGGIGGGLSYQWFSKERRTLDVNIAQAEKTMLQADIRVEDVREAKNKGDINDLEAFMRLSAWVKAKEFGQETSVIQKQFNSILDLPGLRAALGYK